LPYFGLVRRWLTNSRGRPSSSLINKACTRLGQAASLVDLNMILKKRFIFFSISIAVFYKADAYTPTQINSKLPPG
jgi:hypothetical protein